MMPIELMRGLARFWANKVRIRDAATDREDLEQIAMLEMVKAWPGYDQTKGSPGTYLYYRGKDGISKYVDRLRRMPKAAHSSESIDPVDNLRASTPSAERMSIVKQYVEAIPGRDGEVIRLAISGWDDGEIADRFGVTRQRIEQVRKRAIKRSA